jgi:hypothetical protein
MIMLDELISSQLEHGKEPEDIVAVLGFEIGEMLSFTTRESDLPFEALLHQFISNIYKGKFIEQQENDNARTKHTTTPQRSKSSTKNNGAKRP